MRLTTFQWFIYFSFEQEESADRFNPETAPVGNSFCDKGNTIKLTSESENVSEYEIRASGNTMRLGNQEDGYFNLKKM